MDIIEDKISFNIGIRTEIRSYQSDLHEEQVHCMILDLKRYELT